MPKKAQYIVQWSAERNTYLLSAAGNNEQHPLLQQDKWRQWLHDHHAFAFHGHNTAINLLKERRNHTGEGYWYAYQRQAGKMIKRYAGRSEQLSLEHLEHIANSLTQIKQTHEEQEHRPSSYADPLLPAPLLLPKLQIPRPQKSLLRRQRLLDLLDKSLEHKLTVIAGPAGYGKTSLIAQWIAEQSALDQPPTFACLTLDEGDNDVVRFWHYLITACQEFSPDIGNEALALLLAHRLPPFKPLTMMLTSLLNDLSRLQRPAVLVLDDFHAVNSPQVTETLTFFLEHLPSTLHLLLLIRGSAPFSLIRLRARGELLDIYPPSLAFSLEETSTYFTQTLSYPLSLTTVRQIYERIDGWPTALRLFARDLKNTNDTTEIERILTTFTGSHWSIQDYFRQEILPQLAPEQQEFLLQTCILPRFTAKLCDTIIGRDDSASQIAILREADLFLVPLDSGKWEWQRYVPLFAEAMQQEARQRLGDERLRQFAARASLWYEEHHFLAEAIETALTATAFSHAANLIEQFSRSSQQGNLSTISELYSMNRWLEQLPSEEIEHRPDLCIQFAMTLLFLQNEGQHIANAKEHIHHLLHSAEQHWRDQNNTARLAEIFAFRALLARQDGHLLQAITWARQSLAWLPPENRGWHNVNLSVVGMGEVLTGNLQDGCAHLRQAWIFAEQQGNHIYARAIRGMFAWANMEQGALYSSAEQLHQMQTEARTQEDQDDIARTQLLLAQIEYQWHNLQTAEQCAQEALAIGKQMQVEEIEVRATVLLAQIAYVQHQPTEALQRLTVRLAQVPVSSSPASYQLYRELQAAQVRIELARGESTIANRWFNSSEQHTEQLPLLQQQHEQLLRARLLLLQNKNAQALSLLQNLHTAASQTDHNHFKYEIEVVLLLAYMRQGSSEKARTLLRHLLAATQGEGYLRIFLDEGEQFADLLRKLLLSLREKTLLTYARHILNAFAQPHNPSTTNNPTNAYPLTEPLSPQEQKVLSLLAEGNSNAEIARQLVVSINTVRTQVQSIYRKLNVNNRVEASSVAHGQHLII